MRRQYNRKRLLGVELFRLHTYRFGMIEIVRLRQGAGREGTHLGDVSHLGSGDSDFGGKSPNGIGVHGFDEDLLPVRGPAHHNIDNRHSPALAGAVKGWSGYRGTQAL